MKAIQFALAMLIVALPSAAYASNGCVEKSDVVGDRLCSRFGDRWSSERMYRVVLGAGFWTGHVTPNSRSWSGSFGKDTPIKIAVPGRALGIHSVDDVGFDFRLHGYASRNVYLGLDWALAFGAIRTNHEQQPNLEIGHVPGLNYMHTKLGGVVGMRIPLGPVHARLESVIGVEIASVTANARRPGQSEWIRGSFTSVNFLLEPRVAVDLWTAPWSTVTAWGGLNMLYPSERSMGISFALHGRAFDGARD